DGAFDMAGFNQRVAALNSTTSGNIAGVVNSTGTLSTLTIDGSTTQSYAGTIGIPTNTTGVAGATNNIKLVLASTNTGSLTLSSTGNAYTGGTQIDGGTLLVTNASGSGTGGGAVTVGTGAKLGGTGRIAGAVTRSGKLLPGGSAT